VQIVYPVHPNPEVRGVVEKAAGWDRGDPASNL
jgi:hypothetical protein